MLYQFDCYLYALIRCVLAYFLQIREKLFIYMRYFSTFSALHQDFVNALRQVSSCDILYRV